MLKFSTSGMYQWKSLVMLKLQENYAKRKQALTMGQSVKSGKCNEHRHEHHREQSKRGSTLMIDHHREQSKRGSTLMTDHHREPSKRGSALTITADHHEVSQHREPSRRSSNLMTFIPTDDEDDEDLNLIRDMMHNMTCASKRHAFNMWKIYAEQIYLFGHAINILQSSQVHSRTQEQINILSALLKHVHEPTTNVFNNLQRYELDKLSNEVGYHYVDSPNQTLIFLQNEPGFCAYIIVSGTVDLYNVHVDLQDDRLHHEMKGLLGKSISSNNILKLGTLHTSLKTGTIFGELSIISNKNKRRLSAVASPGALLFSITKSTYNEVLRVHRTAQEELTLIADLLHELPLLHHHSEKVIDQLAYKTKVHTYPSRSVIVTAGSNINCLLIIAKGEIKVYPADQKPQISIGRIPQLAVAQLARGMVIGEREIHKELKTYEMTYVSYSSCELIELELAAYQHDLHSVHLRKIGVIHDVQLTEKVLYNIHKNLHDKGKDVIKKSPVTSTSILPMNPILTRASGNGNTSNNRSQNSSTSNKNGTNQLMRSISDDSSVYSCDSNNSAVVNSPSSSFQSSMRTERYFQQKSTFEDEISLKSQVILSIRDDSARALATSSRPRDSPYSQSTTDAMSVMSPTLPMISRPQTSGLGPIHTGQLSFTGSTGNTDVSGLLNISLNRSLPTHKTFLIPKLSSQAVLFTKTRRRGRGSSRKGSS